MAFNFGEKSSSLLPPCPPALPGVTAANATPPTEILLPDSRKRLVPLPRAYSISKVSHVQNNPRHPTTFWLKVPGQPDRPVVLVKGDDHLKRRAGNPTDQPPLKRAACPPVLTSTNVADASSKGERAQESRGNPPTWRSLKRRCVSHLPLVPRRVPLAEEQTRARDSARLQRRLRRSGFNIPPPLPKKVEHTSKVTDEMLSRVAIDLFPVGPYLRHAFMIEHWFDFRTCHGISAQVRPMWEDYQAYFRSCRDRPLEFLQLNRIYCGLRRVHEYLYRERFPDWSIVDDEIKRHDWSKKPRCLTCVNTPNSHRFKTKCVLCTNKNRNPKDVQCKAKRKRLLREIKLKARRQTSSFTLKDLERFLKEADSGDRSLLVCQVVIVVLLCGWCRLEELRHVSRGDVMLVSKGYQITFQPNPTLKVTHKFLIPWKKIGLSNICFADFLRKYFTDLDQNVFTANHTCLFIAGKELKMDTKKKIVGVPMGSTLLFGVGKTVASWLKLSNPDNFAAHLSFREAREEFAQIFGLQTRISIKDELIVHAGESLSGESGFVTADQNIASKQIDDNDCDETDPLNPRSIKTDPSEFEDSDSISVSEGDQIVIETDPEANLAPSSGIFVAEGLVSEPSEDEKPPMELPDSLDVRKSEDSEDLLTTEIKTEDRLSGDAMAYG